MREVCFSDSDSSPPKKQPTEGRGNNVNTSMYKYICVFVLHIHIMC